MALWYLLRAIEVKCLILLENQLIMEVCHINHVIGGKRTALFGYPISNFEEIKEFYKECEIEDIRPIMAKTDMEDNYTSKDQV